ncbi:STAS domain-containing protein [Cynara cardunculus var. scolymus]|uniref:STAS domain-containing protein n=1 Tax=Cynara cardunculus var. scolymus TaxID=59895 RepID=A0A103YBG1_CYNCS|nr:STAS domain-containing protein [Cynara cardunculus var. scolymus]
MGINSNRVDHYSGSGHANRGPTSTAPVTITVSGETMTSLELHNVCLPPQKSTLQKLRHRLSEIFFPDDPLHGFKNQSRLKKLVLALQFFFPIFEWAPNYSFTLLRSDVVSGLTIASLAIPQVYSSFVPPLIYSVLGSSKHLAVGPVSIASLVMGTMLNEAVPYTQNPGLYLKLAFTATFFAGVFQATLGLLRVTRDRPFHYQNANNPRFVIRDSARKRGTEHGMRKPKLFWVSAAAPLASVILSTLLVTLFRSKLHGVATVSTITSNYLISEMDYSDIGHLDKGLNPPSSNMLYFHGSFSRSAVNANAGAKTVVSNIIMASTVLITLLFLMPLFHYTPNLILAAIIITAVIGLIDYQSTVRLWKVDKLDFVACLSSFFGVLFISILLHVTRPNTSVLGNIPGTQIYQNVNRYREARRVPSFVILGIEAPIYFANSTYLQERCVLQLANAIEAKFYKLETRFGVIESLGFFGFRILRWIREEEEWLAANNGSSLRCVIIDMTCTLSGFKKNEYHTNEIENNNPFFNVNFAAVTGIDTSGLAMLVLANPGGSVMEKLHQSNILETFGLEGIYLMVDEAVADISSSWKAQP